MPITLYAAPMSSATPVVHALAELGVRHELVLFDLSTGEHRKPAYLALNPNGKVPTLVVDGTPMFEAVAIMQWLGDRFGVERGLWPAADRPERLEALSWTTWAYVTFGPALQRLSVATSERSPAALRSMAHAEDARGQLQALLDILEGRLRGRANLVGDAFSLADLIVASVVVYGTYCGVEIGDRRGVAGWLERFQQRPGFRAAWASPAA